MILRASKAIVVLFGSTGLFLHVAALSPLCPHNPPPDCASLPPSLRFCASKNHYLEPPYTLVPACARRGVVGWANKAGEEMLLLKACFSPQRVPLHIVGVAVPLRFSLKLLNKLVMCAEDGCQPQDSLLQQRGSLSVLARITQRLAIGGSVNLLTPSPLYY